MEGGGIYALTALLYGEITIDRGRVKQSNFHDYPMLRIEEAPEFGSSRSSTTYVPRRA